MRSRALSAGAVLMAVVVLGGCGAGGGPSSRSASTTPSGTPTASSAPLTKAARVLKELQSSVADLVAVEVSGGTSGSPEIGRLHGTADLRSGNFRATLGIGRGAVLEMIRDSDLTWSRAPAWYWVRLGYTAESARAARNKWVTAPATAVKQLVDAMDPGALIRSIRGLQPTQAESLTPAQGHGMAGVQVLTFRQAGAVQKIFLTSAPRPRLVRLTSTRARVTTTIEFAPHPAPFHLRLPAANDVVQPH